MKRNQKQNAGDHKCNRARSPVSMRTHRNDFSEQRAMEMKEKNNTYILPVPMICARPDKKKKKKHGSTWKRQLSAQMFT